jgi:hypothetical protein
MASDRVFLLLQLLGLFLGLLVMDGGRFLACYLVALIFLNTAYFFLNRRLSKGPFRVLLILSPLMLLFVVLMLLSMKP